MLKLIFILLTIYAFIPTCSSGDCKRNILERKLNRTERSAILKVHNHMRKLVHQGIPGQPKGFNMQHLKWDKKLGKAAQRHADTCRFKHSAVKDERWHVGQNLWELSATVNIKGLNVTNAIYSWFDEHKIYKYPLYSKKTGHYSQIVWADTRYIGCGYTSYRTTKGRFRYKKLLVCNYGPGGNVEGQAPYKIRSRKCKEC